jgi:hypothetical protein
MQNVFLQNTLSQPWVMEDQLTLVVRDEIEGTEAECLSRSKMKSSMVLLSDMSSHTLGVGCPTVDFPLEDG